MATILITGTSKGIGYETALAAARHGHDVIATMRNLAASDLAAVAQRENLPLRIEPLDIDDDCLLSKSVRSSDPRVPAEVRATYAASRQT